jgi:DNA-binding SARP family transcriptional activator
LVSKPRPFGIKCLGRLTIEHSDGVDSDIQGRPRQILTLLMSAPFGTVTREELVDSIWPEADALSGERNLKAGITALRRNLRDGSYIQIRSSAVTLALPAGCRDDQIFEALARRSLVEPDATVMNRALATWAGEYLPQDVYEEWTTYRRSILTDLYRSLVLAATAQTDIGRHDLIPHLRGLLRSDPADEEIATCLVLSLRDSGRRSEAVRLHRTVAGTIRSELGIEPTAEFLDVRNSL